jgi:serine/threonine protein kinase/WD40 repeat protein
MPSSSADRNPVEQLAEEFAERYRRGERPPLSEYVAKYPQYADEIRELFPALVVMEQLKPAAADATGPFEAQPAPAEGRLPERLGDYRILREVGRGGMGVVYEAEQVSLGRRVALKVLPPHALLNPTYLERFRREAKAAAKLHHTNIVPVFGVGEEAGVYFYAMQFIRGEGLDRVLRDLRRLRNAPGGMPSERSAAQSVLTGQFEEPPAVRDGDAGGAADTAPLSNVEPRPSGSLSAAGSDAAYYRSVVRVGLQVAEALAYAHRQGVLHRDIKPSNLLLDAQGTVWITDFGLAKSDGTDELTHSGDIVGTLRFMAPERFDGRSLPQSDVYSLGLTLYELLTLRPAFDDTNQARLIEKVLHEPPIPPRRLDPRVPRDLETVALKSVAKDSSERYATAEALAEDLRRFLADRPVRARRASQAERAWRWARRNPTVASLLGCVTLLLVIVAVGSTLAAVRLNDALGQTRDAEREARLREAEALVGEAHGIRYSRRRGQRFEALAALEKAAAIGRELGQPPQWFDRLRNEAASALALPDVQVDHEWEGVPVGTACLCFDDGIERYARADQQGNVSVRRVADDTEIVHLRGPGSPADVRLSPDGNCLAVYHRKSLALEVWRLSGPEPSKLWQDKDVYGSAFWPFKGVEFSPDNRLLVYSHSDGVISVVTLADGHVTRWPARGTDTHLFFFRPDGRQVMFKAMADRQQTLVVCDMTTGAVLARLPHPAPISWCGWHPSGRMIATSCDDHRIRLWNTATWQQSLELEGHKWIGLGCVFTPEGDRLLTNDYRRLLRVWDVHSGRQLFTTSMGYSMYQFGRDGRLPVLEDAGPVLPGNPIKLLRIATGREFRTLPRCPTGREILVSPDGRLLAAHRLEGTCAFLDPTSGAELAAIRIKDAVPFAFEESGALLTHGSAGLCRWPVATDPATGHCRCGPPQVLSAARSSDGHGSSADGSVLAIPNYGEGALLLRRDRPGAPLVLGPQEDVRHCAVSPDGRWVATGNHHDSQGIGAKVWEADSGQLLKDLRIPGFCGVGFSPDGKWLMTTGGGCRLWAVGSWEEGPFKGKETAFAFSPDGKLLAVGGDDTAAGVIRLIEPTSGREYVRLDAPEQTQLYPACFTPDGTQLIAVGNESQALQVWDLGLIRTQLAAMELDWDAPPYPKLRAAPPGPLEVQVIGTELLPQADPMALNDEAWRLVTGPDGQRDPARAMQLIRDAVKGETENAMFLNTLGLVQYRNGQYREALDTLEKSLAAGKGQSAGFDLFFLAMCHAKLGDAAKAKDCFERAVKWTEAQKNLPAQHAGELKAFRVEAEGVLNGK